MFLLINLSTKDLIQLALFDKETIIFKETAGRNRELLVSIDTFFNEEKFDKKDLKGIMVVTGAGSFTNTRISAVVANTFAYVLNIPLLTIEESQIVKIKDLIPVLLRQPKGQYISATYSGEPNIG